MNCPECGNELLNGQYVCTDTDYEVKAGDRIAQFVVYNNHDVDVSEGEIEESLRGEKGFGSSGK